MESLQKSKERIRLFASAGSNAVAQGSCFRYSSIGLSERIGLYSTILRCYEALSSTET